MVQGSCLCGAVAFEAAGPLRDVVACHCTQCRKTSGHFWAATSVPMERFDLTRDEGLAWFRSSPQAERGHCRRCGSTLFWKHDAEDRISIGAGAIDGPTGLTTAKHIFMDDAGDYYTGGTGVQVATLHGRCLCGGCAFTLPGPAGDITACHCHQCRKLSGHFAASFDAEEAALVWSARDTMREYETPGGGRRGFCTACGSSLYFRSKAGEFSVEAGVIDGATGGRLTDHIFTDQKGDYYGLNDPISRDAPP